MKRRIVVRIDDLRLPAGTAGGYRAAAALERRLAALLRGEIAPSRRPDPPAQTARAVHAALAPHLPPARHR